MRTFHIVAAWANVANVKRQGNEWLDTRNPAPAGAEAGAKGGM